MDIEVQEVRRAILTQVWSHRARMRSWRAWEVALAEDPTSDLTTHERLTARANVNALHMVITALLQVLEDVRLAARARDRAFA